jgi:hypothetical protein
MKSPGVTTMNPDRLYILLFIPTECNAHTMRWSQRNIQLLPIPHAPVWDSFDKIIRTATSNNTTGNYVIHWWWDWNPIWWSIRVLLSAAKMWGKKHNMCIIKSWPVPANEELKKNWSKQPKTLQDDHQQDSRGERNCSNKTKFNSALNK